jgi:putative hydrolase
MKELKADLHVHTVASGHSYSTIREICFEARERGIELVGMTDHGPAMLGGPCIYHFANLIVVPREIYGVRVLRSAECNIVGREGELDIHDRILDVLDIVQAGFHPLCGFQGEGVTDNTKAILKVIESGKVDVLVHPGNVYYPLDYTVVVEAATGAGVALEINNSSFVSVRKGSEENCEKIAREAARTGARISVASDAHDASLVAVFDHALALVERVGIDDSQIVNRDLESVIAFLRSRGKDIGPDKTTGYLNAEGKDISK